MENPIPFSNRAVFVQGHKSENGFPFFDCTLRHYGHIGGILTKDFSLASIVNTTNMAAMSLSVFQWYLQSLGNGYGNNRNSIMVICYSMFREWLWSCHIASLSYKKHSTWITYYRTTMEGLEITMRWQPIQNKKISSSIKTKLQIKWSQLTLLMTVLSCLLSSLVKGCQAINALFSWCVDFCEASYHSLLVWRTIKYK